MKTIYDERYVGMMAELKAIRKDRGLTQLEVGARLDRSASWLTKVEHCELRLDILFFVDLCAIYEISVGDFLSRYE